GEAYTWLVSVNGSKGGRSARALMEQGYLSVVNSGLLVASDARRPISPWMSPKTHRSLTLSPRNVKTGAPYHHTWRPVGAWPNIGLRWIPWKRSFPETALPSSRRSRISDV